MVSIRDIGYYLYESLDFSSLACFFFFLSLWVFGFY